MLGTEPGEVFGKRPTKRADKRDMCTPFAPICASTAGRLNAELAAAGMLSPKFCVWSHTCDGMPLSEAARCDRRVQERRQIAMQLRTRPFPIVHDGGLELLPDMRAFRSRPDDLESAGTAGHHSHDLSCAAAGSPDGN